MPNYRTNLTRRSFISACGATALAPALASSLPVTADSSFDQFWVDAQKSKWVDKSLASQRRLDWWRQARFGMFIHWDPSSVGVSEISWSKQFYDDDGERLLDNPRPSPELYNVHERTFWLDWFKPPMPRSVYDNLYKSFYPGMFDADEFVGTAKRAGMKYLVQVSKHHNGFCMWNTKFSTYNVMNTPFRRDILGEMAKACERAGIEFGIYYSQRDWHHPDYGPERMAKYNEYMHNQIRELLTNYPNIRLIFFDCEQYYPWQMWEGDKMFRIIHELRPDIVINNRCGVPADYDTPEQRLGAFSLDRDWESNMTFTGFWSWHGFQTTVIPFEETLGRLARCAGGNGNLLMNVGPMPTGQIDPREVDRLLRVGAWLQRNGESIYGTKGGPYKPGKDFVSTRKGNAVYLHFLGSAGETEVLPPLPLKMIGAALLDGTPVSFEQTTERLRLIVPQQLRQPGNTVVKLQLAQPATEIAPIEPW
jgi:alpha-L-fucosidase